MSVLSAWQNLLEQRACDFSWGSDVWHPIRTGETLDGETNEPKLLEGFEALSPAAAMAVATASVEICAAALRERVRAEDLADFALAIAAGWHSLTKPDEVKFPKNFPYPVNDTPDPHAQGALKLAAMQLSKSFSSYHEDDSSVYVYTLGCALLARHIIDDKQLLNTWLEGVLERFAVTYARQASSNGPPISRASFDATETPSTRGGLNPYIGGQGGS